MSGGERIASALARARQAGRALQARSLEERLAAVGRVLDAWSEPDGRWQRGLVRDHAAHTGFSEANVRDGLGLALAAWKSDALRATAGAELAGPGSNERPDGAWLPFSVTSVLLAGSIPLPSLLQLLLPLVVGSPVVAKAASRDPVTPPRVLDSVRVLAPELAPCIELVEPASDDDTRVFFSAPCIVASGSDATIAAVRTRLDAGQRLIAHPNKLSVAILGRSALDGGAADRIALDASLWDQLGCLSPVAVYLVGVDARAASAFARELARALADREAAFPTGRVETGAAAAIRTERDEARLRISTRAAGALHESPDGLAWTVTLEADTEPRPAPLHRFLRVYAVDDEAGLGRALSPFGRHLSSVALDGFTAPEQTRIAGRVAALGASRVCRPGHMQTPPLGWHHDGMPVFQSLIRSCDFEF